MKKREKELWINIHNLACKGIDVTPYPLCKVFGFIVRIITERIIAPENMKKFEEARTEPEAEPQD